MQDTCFILLDEHKVVFDLLENIKSEFDCTTEGDNAETVVIERDVEREEGEPCTDEVVVGDDAEVVVESEGEGEEGEPCTDEVVVESEPVKGAENEGQPQPRTDSVSQQLEKEKELLVRNRYDILGNAWWHSTTFNCECDDSDHMHTNDHDHNITTIMITRNTTSDAAFEEFVDALENWSGFAEEEKPIVLGKYVTTPGMRLKVREGKSKLNKEVSVDKKAFSELIHG
jgi:hypothetical protein